MSWIDIKMINFEETTGTIGIRYMNYYKMVMFKFIMNSILWGNTTLTIPIISHLFHDII